MPRSCDASEAEKKHKLKVTAKSVDDHNAAAECDEETIHVSRRDPTNRVCSRF